MTHPDPLGAALANADHELGHAAEALQHAPLPDLLAALELIAGIRKSLATVSTDVEHRAGEVMGEKSVTVDGVEWVRSMPPKRSGWKSDDLLRAVLDTRLVDERTGEVVEETPLDKVKHVYPLAGYQARKTALEARGLDVNDFSEAAWDSRLWKVAKAADKKKGRGK